MVVSNTIRQEQDASAKTAPLIERTMDTILATTRNITGQNFFQELFYMPVSDSAEQLATSNHATDFKNAIQRLTADSIVTDVQIYVDFPDDLKTLDTYPNTENILAPLSQAKGTYWYGIFQGNRNTQEMFCPSFYLGPREKKNYGDMAYICPLSLYYHSTAYKAYLAVYYSDDKLTSILSDNLSLEGSVSYIVNERDAIVATSDLSLSGIYQLDYDTIKLPLCLPITSLSGTFWTQRFMPVLQHCQYGLVYGDGPSFPAADPCEQPTDGPDRTDLCSFSGSGSDFCQCTGSFHYRKTFFCDPADADRPPRPAYSYGKSTGT